MAFHKKLVVGIILVLLVSGCIGLQRDRDGDGQGPIPKLVHQAAIECRNIVPSDTDTSIDQWTTAHYVCVPQEEQERINKLFLFFPGTGGAPQDYEELTKEAARAGYHAIALSYPNNVDVTLQMCINDPDTECPRNARNEILYGDDTSPHARVNDANSILNRLLKSLSYLGNTYPNEGWQQFLNNNEVQWQLVTAAGHSQGGGHATFLSKKYRVNRTVIFAWADVKNGKLAPWILEPGATAPSNYYLFWHLDDMPAANFEVALAEALGADAFGPVVNVDNEQPPYDGTHTLATDIPVPGSGGRGDILRPHNVIVADEALVQLPEGFETYKDVWRYLIAS